MQVLRIDDIPVLYAQVKELGIQQIIDDRVQIHGNWSGISLGHLVSIWMCYLLSESDHRLSAVEEWASANIILLGTLSGEKEIRSKDFTDDRLEQALDYISMPSNWLEISSQINVRSLSVYDLDSPNTVRLDSAPMQGHHQIKAGGLFQHGYSKHHDPRLGMVKIMLACVDNELNGFGYPLAHLTVSGEQADDGLYIPLIEQSERVFKSGGYDNRKLYVGDSKMGSKKNRAYIFGSGNDYLMPLSRVQLSSEKRNELIEKVDNKTYKKVYKIDSEGKKEVVAQGFEQGVERKYMDLDGKEIKWKERQVFILSTSYSLAQKKALDTRLKNTIEELIDLTVAKKGKTIPKEEIELKQKIEEIIRNKGLGGLLDITIEKKVKNKKIRPYKDRPARTEKQVSFRVKVRQNEVAIEAHKKTLGWQVYATSAAKNKLNFEGCVWKYRFQNRVERRFDDLRNKVVPLVPIFVTQENRVEALINLLMICLKICAVIEYKVAKSLHKNKEELNAIYEGNPKRSTATPTARRLLKTFRGISLVIFNEDKPELIPEIKLTELNAVQKRIIELLDFRESLYEELVSEMQLFFSGRKMPES